MVTEKTRQQEYIALCRKRDIAAYGVVGTARAIFNAYAMPAPVTKMATQALEEFDQADKAVKEFKWEETA